MAYRTALEVPLQMQWDADSRQPYPDPGTAGGNCGPTAVVQVANYYRDTDYGIYPTRRLAVTHLKLSTSVQDQRKMLAARGVPCRLARPTIPQLHTILATGRRPVIIGMDMGLVPDAIAGHDFQDDHAVTLRANARGGFLAADGNFSRKTNRLDPTNGRRFYPDWVVQRAYWSAGKWAIVPDRDKVVDLPDTALPEDDVNPDWYKPIAVCRVAPGGTVYADPLRKVMLIKTWVGQATVGLYALPVSPTSKSLVPIRIEISGKLRVGYVGLDKVSDVRLP